MSQYKPGQSVRSSVQVTQLPAPPATLPVLFDPPSIVLTVCFPDGSQVTPTVSRDGVGIYHADYLIPFTMQYGPAFERWRCANGLIDANAVRERRFTVMQLDF